MRNYSDYNIIPIGDHCAISIILKELNLRNQSFPFDWVTNANELKDTNILYNLNLINELHIMNNVDEIVKNYIGNALENNTKINSLNNILFPHEFQTMSDTFEKYKRRFIRLKECLNNKNIFILLTRSYYIEENIFQQIMEQLLNYNNNSVILFISGIEHSYFKNINNDNVIFKYIEYDLSKWPAYDYSDFRPNIKKFLSDFFL